MVSGSVERLLVDPHEGPRLVGLTLVVDAAELVAELAVLPLVVVVVFGLPDRLKGPRFVELDRKRQSGLYGERFGSKRFILIL